jgi:hypothetical protein
MARGNSRAQSEAGTIERSKTAANRIKTATSLLEGGAPASDVVAALNRPRASQEEYDIGLVDTLDVAGKLNMMDGTINGKEIALSTKGAFSNTSTARRGSRESARDFEYEKEKMNTQEGFIFAKDEKGEVFAIPHNWNVNDPQGTVGVFKGDTLTVPSEKTGDRVLTIIGTFDNSKRGLNLAAAAAGESIGRSMGVKQTATILTQGGKVDAGKMTDQTRQSGKYLDMTRTSYSQLPGDLVSSLNAGRESGGLRNDFTVSRRNG